MTFIKKIKDNLWIMIFVIPYIIVISFLDINFNLEFVNFIFQFLLTSIPVAVIIFLLIKWENYPHDPNYSKKYPLKTTKFHKALLLIFWGFIFVITNYVLVFISSLIGFDTSYYYNYNSGLIGRINLTWLYTIPLLFATLLTRHLYLCIRKRYNAKGKDIGTE